MTTDIPDQKCWFCGATQNQVSHLPDDRRKPKPDDYNVCINCAAPGIFTPELIVRRPTAKEIIEFFLDDDCSKQWLILAAYLASHGKKDAEVWNIGKELLV
jgi:hypothetical protein